MWVVGVKGHLVVHHVHAIHTIYAAHAIHTTHAHSHRS